MDENRVKKIIQSVLDNSFSGTTMSEFKALPTSKWDEDKSDWVQDSHSLFITLQRGKTLDGNSYNILDIENLISSIMGFECCVNFF
jgi:hypothetical protein